MSTKARSSTPLAVVASFLAAGIAAPAAGLAETADGCTGLNLEALRRSNSSEGHTIADYINLEDCEGGETWELRYTISGFNAATFANAMLTFYTGETCGTVEDRSSTARECTLVTDPASMVIDQLDGQDTIPRFPVSSIVGSGCAERGSVYLWAVVMDSDGADQIACGRLRFLYDMDPPAPPTITAASGSQGGARLSWTVPAGSTNEDHDNFVVYCAEATTTGGTPDGGAEGCDASEVLPAGSDHETLEGYEVSRVGTSARSARVSGLSEGTTYACAIASMDQADNVGPSSEPVCVTPVPVDAFFDVWQEAGGESGYCFVATTAYGEPDHPDLELLRWFRDSVLVPTRPGRWLVARYYEHGGGWAVLVGSRPAATLAVRGALGLTCAGIRAARSPLSPLLLVLAALAVGVTVRRRSRKNP